MAQGMIGMNKTLNLFAWPDKEDLERVLIHIPVGLVAGFSYFAHWIFPLVIMGAFLYYEWSQGEDMLDQSWKDVKGAIWGICFVSVVVAILKLTGVI